VNRIGLKADCLLCVLTRLPAYLFSCLAPHVLFKIEEVYVYFNRTFSTHNLVPIFPWSYTDMVDTSMLALEMGCLTDAVFLTMARLGHG
jgi:hypothetical protein